MVKRFIEEKPVKAKDHYHNTAAAQMEVEVYQSLVGLDETPVPTLPGSVLKREFQARP
jgi:hypothetical protein